MSSMKTIATMALASATIAAPASVASAQAPPPHICAGYSGLPEDRAPAGNARSDMMWIDGGSFTMGSDEHHPEERRRMRSHSRASGSTATR